MKTRPVVCFSENATVNLLEGTVSEKEVLSNGFYVDRQVTGYERGRWMNEWADG